MPSTPCRQYRCPNLTTRKTRDTVMSMQTNEATGPSARQNGQHNQRGYGHAWRKLRAQVLDRDGHLCMACKRSGYRYVPATDVDHIISKANGGTDELENLQSLCKKCHLTKTANE